MGLLERRYTRDDAWIDPNGDVGVTARLLERGLDVRAVRLADVGETLRAAGLMGSLETAKGVVDLYAPCGGVVLARNEAVLEAPALLIESPETTWLLRVDGQSGRLLSLDEYLALER